MTLLFMKCPTGTPCIYKMSCIFEMSYLRNVLPINFLTMKCQPSMKCPIYELSYLWTVLSMIMSYLWNVLSMIMSHLWNVLYMIMSHQRNVLSMISLSMKCRISKMAFYEMAQFYRWGLKSRKWERIETLNRKKDASSNPWIIWFD